MFLRGKRDTGGLGRVESLFALACFGEVHLFILAKQEKIKWLLSSVFLVFKGYVSQKHALSRGEVRLEG